MRKIKIVLLILYFLFFLPLSSASLIAYYSFEGNADDFSGSGYHGTNYGATLVSGYRGQAFYFDGSDYIYSGLNINPSALTQLTMGAWVKASNSSPVRQVISHDNGGYDRSLGIDSRGGGTGWSAFKGSGVIGYSPVSLEEWVFIAVSYNQATSTAMLYVNGVTYSSTSGLGEGYSYTNIGRNPLSGGVEYFIGTIDEVFFYSEALNASQLDNIRLNGIVPELSTCFFMLLALSFCIQRGTKSHLSNFLRRHT